MMAISEDDRAVLGAISCAVGFGCLAPALILLGFLWGVVTIFGWGS